MEQRKFLPAVSTLIQESPYRFDSFRKAKHIYTALFFLAFIALSIALSVPAQATSNGISGFSGMNGSTCTGCHSSGTAPTVTLTGPTSVASGSTNSYTLSVSTVTAGNGGMDLAASGGTFAAGTGTKVLNGEVVHSAPSSTHTWTFSWTAPTVTATSTVTFYAAAIDSFGGGTGTLKQAITVTAPVANPTLSTTPASLSFSYQTGGTVPGAQSVSVASSGSAISYNVSTSATWLSATPASGSTPGTVSVSVKPTSLAAGTYTGSVTLTSSGASNSPKTIPITLTVTSASLPTITATPSNLSFTYQTGGATAAAQTVNLTSSSSSSALSYSVVSSAAWLVATPASGSTPGSLSISVNPSGLSAGTYSGTVTVTASGASNSPLKIGATLTVSSATTGASLTLTPGSLSFNYQSGSAAAGSQTLSVASTGAALNFTAAASGGSWLSVSPTTGSTPGSLKVAVNASGLAAGTYNGSITITSSTAANSPQTVPVRLVIGGSGGGTGHLRIWPPRAVTFEYQSGQADPAPRSIKVLSTGTPLSFTASALGGSWLSVTPSGGRTPGTLSISANPTGLASGTYTATVKLSAQGTNGLSVPVVLRVVSSDDGGGDDGGGDDGGSGGTGGSTGGGEDDASTSLHAWPYAYDPAGSNSVAATWVDGTGAATKTPTDTRQQGLLLSKTSAASTQAQAGVVIRDVEGMTLTQLGYDIRTGSQCTATSPRFVVVTTDDVVHKIGCSTGTAQPAPAAGWTRLRFDPANPAQTSPAIATGSKIKSIYLVLDDGPETGASMVVIDNININGTFIGKQ